MNKKLQQKLIKISFDLIDIPKATNKHFSYILDGNKIVSIGWNDAEKTHPMSARFKYWNGNIHSELDVIKRYKGSVNELRHMKMVNVRVNRLGSIQNSCPCVNCKVLLNVFELKEVWYTDANAEFRKISRL